MPRKFGVEIEFAGTIADVAAQLRSDGLPVENRSTTHLGHSNHAWTVKRDGSVQRGGELVSPPLDFDDPEHREIVNRAVMCLQRAGAKPHESAGIHVHIEARHEDGAQMTGRELASVVRFTYKFEDVIYRIASSGWNTIRPCARTYAVPIPEQTARSLMACKERDEVFRVWDGYPARVRTRGPNAGIYGRMFTQEMERYAATNLRAISAHDTIEFRYFNSSVNPNRIQAYIALCMAIVQDARNGFSRSVAKSYRLGAMANGEVKPEAAFLRLQQILRSNSKDSKICMSESDWKNLRKTCWGKNSLPQLPFDSY